MLEIRTKLMQQGTYLKIFIIKVLKYFFSFRLTMLAFQEKKLISLLTEDA